LFLVLTNRGNTNAIANIRKYFDLPSSQEIRSDYDTRVKKLTPGTATWLLEQPAFIEWNQSVKPVLSLYGNPGSGKSYLSTMIIKHLHQTRDRNTVIGHYYFHDNDQQKRSVLKSLRAIVYQIAEQDEIYGQHASETCQQAPSLSATTIDSIWNDFILPEFGSESKSQLQLIFDGVDEAKPNDVQNLVLLIQNALEAGSRIKALLVGRPEIGHIISPLEEFSTASIQVSQSLNSKDISRYIDYKYDEYMSKRRIGGLRELVTGSLREKANGMFLWVDLTYEELKSIKQPIKLKEALKKLPTGLTDLYDQIFSRIQTNTSGSKLLTQLREIFCVLTYSENQPTVLLLNEFVEFVTKNDSVNVEDVIEKICSSFISLDEKGKLLFEKLKKHGSFDNEENFQPLETDELEVLLDIDEAQEEENERQNNLIVKLCHASVGDYLKSNDLQSSDILFNRKDGLYHMVETHLRIACAGEDVPEPIWLNSMVTIWDQLRKLDEHTKSPEQIRLIVELIWELFTSQRLAKYISQIHFTREGYWLLSDAFLFGNNTDLEHNCNLEVVIRWLKIAEKGSMQQMKSEICSWVKQVLQARLKILVPLTETCIREWISCNDSAPYKLFYRFKFAWRCLVTVRCN